MKFPIQTLPIQMQEAKQWLTHVNKVPSIAPNAFQQEGKGLSLQEAIQKVNGASGAGIGLMFGDATQIACIDIDAPKEIKADWQQYIIDNKAPQNIASIDYHRWLLSQPYMQSALAQLPIPNLHTLSYTDLSPSASGLHIWLNIIDKQTTQQAYIKSKNKSFHGQISLRSQYVTCTGISISGTQTQLLPISLAAFINTFPFSPVNSTTFNSSADEEPPLNEDGGLDLSAVEQLAPAHAQHLQSQQQTQLTVKEVLDALQLLPATPTIQLQQLYETVTGDTFELYQYWLSVGMALHSYAQETGQQIQLFTAFLEWSKRNEAAFTSDERVEMHWRSFDNAPNNAPKITIRTLMFFVKNIVFQYPRPIFKDGRATRYPKLNEYANFQYLMDRYNIIAHNDQSGGVYISGDKDIMKRYFTFPSMTPPILDKFYGPYSPNGLITATTQLCQNAHWQGLQNTKNLVTQWVERASILDIFQEWLDTPYAALPDRYRMIRTSEGLREAADYNDNSTVNYLFNCLNVKPQAGSATSKDEEMELYYACLEKTLYHIVKYREQAIRQSYRNDSGGMLILVGPEHTYKSTFCRMLLPVALQHLRKEVNSQINNAKAERDFIRYLGSRAIVQLDEFEGMMNMKTHSSFFKNLLSSDNMSQVDIYNTSETSMQRKAIIIATTNEVQHVLSREGSRRLWFIPTGTIDTAKVQYFNHHKFYNDLRQKLKEEYIKGKMVWQLTKQQSELRSNWNNSYAATSSLATIMEELWPFATTQMPEDYLDDIGSMKTPASRGTKLMRIGDIAAIIRENGYAVNLAQLKHELSRMCAAWTGTTTQDKDIKRGMSKIIKGKACQNWYEPKRCYQYEYWVMPPLSKVLSFQSYEHTDESSFD